MFERDKHPSHPSQQKQTLRKKRPPHLDRHLVGHPLAVKQPLPQPESIEPRKLGPAREPLAQGLDGAITVGLVVRREPPRKGLVTSNEMRGHLRVSIVFAKKKKTNKKKKKIKQEEFTRNFFFPTGSLSTKQTQVAQKKLNKRNTAAAASGSLFIIIVESEFFFSRLARGASWN
jgi:hypothetical protein